jgi:hypothetical protein
MNSVFRTKIHGINKSNNIFSEAVDDTGDTYFARHVSRQLPRIGSLHQPRILELIFPIRSNLPYVIEECRRALNCRRMQASYAIKLPCSVTRCNGQLHYDCALSFKLLNTAIERLNTHYSGDFRFKYQLGDRIS